MNFPNSEKPSLFFYEWLAIVILVGLILMLTFISRSVSDVPMPASRTLPSIALNEIDITIDGAVENPGKYTVKKGATLQEILDQAKLVPTANLKHINVNRKFRKGQNVHIPSLEMITVYLQGAVNKPGAYDFPKGTRWVDLKDKLLFTENAELSFLDKKKKLKANEVITIPHISQE
jgi:DNA uptake protein ComE-like DNA-binding protein